MSVVTGGEVVSRLLGLQHHGGTKEAVLLFNSGSSGEPKGVVLSHRSILGNIAQFSSLLNMTSADSIMASLPFFHCFGCTVTLWYPITGGVRVISYPPRVTSSRMRN